MVWMLTERSSQITKLKLSAKTAQATRFRLPVSLIGRAMRAGSCMCPHLAPDTGMLFVFDPPRKVGFWMRNTRIPLDMIFIGEDGRIASIVTRHDINSDRLTTSRKPVAAVLEIAAGRAACSRCGGRKHRSTA